MPFSISFTFPCPCCGKTLNYSFERGKSRSVPFTHAGPLVCPECGMELMFHVMAVQDCFVMRHFPRT